MFGDHLGDVSGGPANWAASLQSCEQLVARMKMAGGDVELMHLPKMGIKGNSHMLMQDRNNLQLADLVLQWIDRHAETAGKTARTN
jgi:dipeptidyl aminopeptidase/acylaminoacyl peptidase